MEVIKRKIGPLPVWGWIVVVIVGIFVMRAIRSFGGSGSGGGSSAPATPDAVFGGSGGVGNLSGIIEDPNDPVVQQPTPVVVTPDPGSVIYYPGYDPVFIPPVTPIAPPDPGSTEPLPAPVSDLPIVSPVVPDPVPPPPAPEKTYCFSWFGRNWGGKSGGTLTQFKAELRKRGASYETWKKSHMDAARCIEKG